MTLPTVDTSPLKNFDYNQISNHNFCYGLLTPDLKCIHTPSPCKDYLQDAFWCEYNKKPGNIYGLYWEPGMIDLSQKRFYIGIFGNGYILDHAKMQELINYFDEAQGIDPTIVLETTDPSIVVLDFDREWTLSCPMLSALTSVVRISGKYEGGDPIPFLYDMYKLCCSGNAYYSAKPEYTRVEIGRLGSTFPKLLALLAGKVFSFDWEKLGSTMAAHSTGIMGYTDFPTVPLSKEYL